MSLEIHHDSYGQLSNLADSLIIELHDRYIKLCEIQLNESKPLYVCCFPIENTLQYTQSECLINALNHFQFHRKTYTHIFISYSTIQFTLCPQFFYSSEHSRSLLEFNTGSVQNKFILTNDIKSEIKLIFAMDEGLKSTIDKLYPNHSLHHNLTILSKLILFSDEFIKDNIVLSVNDGFIDVVVKQGTDLLLLNQYTVKCQEDILYYILFVFEQCHLNPLTANLKLIGNVNSNSILIQTLKKYIKNVTLAIGNKKIDWSNIQGAPQHFNYTLINRIFCE